jgi:hypothetical protein
MKAVTLLKKIAWVFAALGILLVIVVLDWLPTVKNLNQLRREQKDEALKIKNFTTLASSFVFPDKEEKSLFARNNARLRRSLPLVRDDDAWAALVLLELQARVVKDRIAHARVLFTPQVQGTEIGISDPEKSDPLADWLFSRQIIAIGKGFRAAGNPGSIRWQEIITSLGSVRGRQPASRVLAVALTAPLPALLDFVTHISWGETRLEIVRLFLEPGASPSRAWLACRGSYLSNGPSRWILPQGAGSGDGLLVDLDSPLLGRKVNGGMMPEVSRDELSPAVPKPK